MAFGLLDFARHRKLFVLVGVVSSFVLIFYLYALSYGSSSPLDVKLRDSNEHLIFDVASAGERTSTDAEKHHRAKNASANEQPKHVPINKGNIALGRLQQAGEDGDNYPEHGVEIKPLAGDEAESKDAQGEKLNARSEKYQQTLKDKDSRVSEQDGPRQPEKEDLYVHSSMPLGPALKIHHTERQKAVVDAFKHAWSGYRKYAWGEDDLRPLSKSHSSVDYGMAMTMVDSLDTLWLMGLQEEFNEARDWIANNLRFDNNPRKVIVFEVNIRVLGGLLSAYHLSGDKVFLTKAILLGNRLLPAFGTPSGLPVNRLCLQNGLSDLSKNNSPNYGTVNIAEAGSVQLEFKDLSRVSGDHRYQSTVDRALNIIFDSSSSGLYPQYFSVSDGHVTRITYTTGSGSDSFYEYLLKQWVQSNKSESKFLTRYLKSAEAISSHLVGYTKPNSLPFLGFRKVALTGSLHNTMEHLTCYYPGLLALGLLYDLHPEQQSLAEGLTKSCYLAYNSTRSGLAADSFRFNTNAASRTDYVENVEGRNIQRPETVESLFVMYRLTKDSKYREWGWRIFQAFEKNMRVEGGYASISDVSRYPAPRSDRMESFFLAETLKYLFLLFGDNDSIVSLHEWVFNTEGHPLPIWKHQGQPGVAMSPGHATV